MKIIYLIITFLVASLGKTYSQFDYNALLPPSPTASGLGQYGNVPVSLYTGTPNISVPLGRLKGNELDIPISLSYMAKGVKVEDVASWVGTGWSLNCTGVITRTIRGLEDGSQPRVTLPLPSTKSGVHEVMLSVVDQFVDPEPDLYYFNFPGYSGSFVLDESGEAVLGDVKNIRIKRDPGIFSKFTITVENGTQFIFNNSENTSFLGSSTSSSNSAMYLTQVISATGKEVINFSYETEITKYHSLPRPKKWIRPNNIVFPENSVPAFGVTTITGLRLSQIVTNFGQNVRFVPDSIARLDLMTVDESVAPKALKQMEFYDQDDNIRKRFIFDYETVETAIPYVQQAIGDPPSNQSTLYSNFRLYLKRVSEVSGDSMISNPPYVFNYFGRTAANKDLLPSKLSAGQDHWGYFNGAPNSDLWPGYSGPFGSFDWRLNVVFICSGVVVDVPSFNIAGSDREPHDPFMKYGTLSSIKYPTGGRTTFLFEPNKYMYATDNGGPVTTTVMDQIQAYVPGGGPQLEDVVTSNKEGFPLASFDFQFEVTCWDSNTHEPMACGTSGSQVNVDKFQGNSVALLDSNNHEVIAVKWLFGDGGFWIYKDGLVDTEIGMLQPDASGFISRLVPNLPLDQGTYTLKATKDPDGDTDVFGWFNYPKEVFVQNENEAPLGGGIRIKRIEDFNESNASVGLKTYDYGLGVLLDGPRYATYTFRTQQGTSTWFQKCNISQGDDSNLYLEVGCGSHSALGYTQGSPIGYASAIENHNGNGSIEYEYTTGIEFPDNGDNTPTVLSMLFWAGDPARDEMANFTVPGGKPAWPFISQDNLDRKRGFLKSVTYRNNLGQQLQKTSNTPIMTDIGNVMGLRVQQLRPDIDWMYSIYKYSSGFVNVSTNSVSQYPGIGKTTNFYYESPNHKLVTKEEFIDSRGDTLVTQYRYPDDYVAISDPNHVISQMKAANSHIIGSPIETQIFRGGQIIDGSVNVYSKFNKAGGGFFLAPKSFYKTRQGIANPSPQWLADPMQPDENVFSKEFDLEFDGIANLAKVLPRNQISLALIWEPNCPIPIAKVARGSNSEIAYTSFETLGTGNWSVTGLVRNENASHTGENSYSLTSGNISKSGLVNGNEYVVSFWAMGGAVYLNGTLLASANGNGINGWNYFESILTASSAVTGVSISGTAMIDELRMYPKGSEMTTYTYDPLVGITSTTDPNNITSYYEYDELGRLKLIKDDKGNILKRYKYHYAQSSESGQGGQQ